MQEYSTQWASLFYWINYLLHESHAWVRAGREDKIYSTQACKVPEQPLLPLGHANCFQGQGQYLKSMNDLVSFAWSCGLGKSTENGCPEGIDCVKRGKRKLDP